MVTLRRALALSLNVATVKVAEMVGYDKVAALWSKKLGIGAPIQPYPAVALGSFEATPYELATAYNVLANGGLKVEPVTVLRVTRREEPRPRAAPPARARSAWSCAGSRRSWSRDMLRSVLNEGTAAGARGHGVHAPTPPARPAPRTTIATPGSRASRPDLLAVVWVGFDDNTPVGPLRHQGGAADLGRLHEGRARRPASRRFPRPAGGHRLRRRSTARRACSPARAAPRRGTEAFVAGTEPREVCGAHGF